MMYKLCFYVPDAYLEQVKQAVFLAGAGTVGNYSHCCWQVLGKGQFKPLSESTPFIGKQNELEYVDEWRVELVVSDKCIDSVITALLAAHPYETPAYDIVKLVNF